MPGQCSGTVDHCTNAGAINAGATIDGATLHLCRQGPRWVVVIESPRVTGTIALPGTRRDGFVARSDLLVLARLACPDAAIMSTDDASTCEDDGWRIEVRGVVGHPGDLGLALRGALSVGAGDDDVPARPTIGRRCHWGLSPPVTGRPVGF
jgi:hypothetical protein